MTPGAGIFRTTLPLGFSVGGVNSGVRMYRPDLGMIVSERPCVAAGVFTKSTCKAAPVLHCQKLLPADNIKAVITNSGEANAGTGEEGILNNQQMVDEVARVLKCSSTQVLSASTGVIGRPLSIDKIKEAIPALCENMTKVAEKFAVAILTTDLVPKTIHKEVSLSQGVVHITGICKGSGMIHPNMATMLGYLLTDVVLKKEEAQVLLREATDCSFNMVSVDGETSTNDSVFLLANGMTKVSLNTKEDFLLFKEALFDVAISLAKSIARDGEGASKLIEVEVLGAEDHAEAIRIAKSIITSPLIKTAVHGESPNWGRILARLGAEQLSEKVLDQCDISMQGIMIFSKGAPLLNAEMELLKKKLKEDTIHIHIHLHHGEGMATGWGCDLTEKYVKINAEYLS